MGDCPYFDTSHSTADLYYICKAEAGQRKINSEDIKGYPCFTDEHTRCRHYPDKGETEETKE